MVTIKLMKIRLQELRKELYELEKAGYSADNLEKVRDITKKAKGIEMAIRQWKQKLGLHVA